MRCEQHDYVLYDRVWHICADCDHYYKEQPMNPYLKLAIRVAAAGILALAVSLQGNLPGVDGNDLIEGVIAGVIGAITFSGIELATPVNSSLGAFKK